MCHVRKLELRKSALMSYEFELRGGDNIQSTDETRRLRGPDPDRGAHTLHT